ncbi:MAG: biopolymer transporter ExbD [Kordia sp.]|nr:MAG: biopolymer transporter ExbD [Kordia sp.]
MGKRSTPEVDSGSMADIAFLLLIFFLVTTTMEQDNGIMRKLPAWEEIPDTERVVIRQKNIFTVVVNKNDQMLVEDELMELKDLRKAAMNFIDNGGGVNADGDKCDYCNGSRDPASSDHPSKAIISLKNERETSYSAYVAIQNELGAAYTELRNREAVRLYGAGNTYTVMNIIFKDPKVKDVSLKVKLEQRLNKLKKMYPQIISEAESKSN